MEIICQVSLRMLDSCHLIDRCFFYNNNSEHYVYMNFIHQTHYYKVHFNRFVFLSHRVQLYNYTAATWLAHGFQSINSQTFIGSSRNCYTRLIIMTWQDAPAIGLTDVFWAISSLNSCSTPVYFVGVFVNVVQWGLYLLKTYINTAIFTVRCKVSDLHRDYQRHITSGLVININLKHANYALW